MAFGARKPGLYLPLPRRSLGWMVICLLCIAVARPARSDALDPVLFVVPEFPPLTYRADGGFRGIGIQRVGQLLDKLELDYEIELALNYARAARLVEIGQKDGFFLATRNEQRERFAVFVGPVYINRWTWFLPVSSELDPRASGAHEHMRAASVVGTNTARWLKKNGFSLGLSPRSVEQLLKMLDGGKVDAVLLSAPVFQHAVETSGRLMSAYRGVVQESKPMGVYLSRQYLRKHPGMLQRFNEAVESLAPEWQ